MEKTEVKEGGLIHAHTHINCSCITNINCSRRGAALSLRYEAAAFFLRFSEANVPRIAIENPVSVMSTLWRKPDCVIHPWQFGHPEEKTTCLWLKGLPKLQPTNIVREEMLALPKKERERNHFISPGPERAKLRSKTYKGIARAMAEQWGGCST